MFVHGLMLFVCCCFGACLFVVCMCYVLVYCFLFLVCCVMFVVRWLLCVVCYLLFAVRCFFFSFFKVLFDDRAVSFCGRMLIVGCGSSFVVRVVCSLSVVRCLLFACCLFVVCPLTCSSWFVACGLLLFVVSRLPCVYR